VASIDGGKDGRIRRRLGGHLHGLLRFGINGMAPLWSLAGQFALADHFYASATGSAPSNPLYLVAASDNNFYLQRFSRSLGLPEPDAAAQPFTFPNVGDQLTSKSVTWTWFQENLKRLRLGYVAAQNPFQYFTSNAKQRAHSRSDEFLRSTRQQHAAFPWSSCNLDRCIRCTRI